MNAAIAAIDCPVCEWFKGCYGCCEGSDSTCSAFERANQPGDIDPATSEIKSEYQYQTGPIEVSTSSIDNSRSPSEVPPCLTRLTAITAPAKRFINQSVH